MTLVRISDAYITYESFGSCLPDNWEQIAHKLNDIIDNELTHYDRDENEDADGDYVDREDLIALWERTFD